MIRFLPTFLCSLTIITSSSLCWGTISTEDKTLSKKTLRQKPSGALLQYPTGRFKETSTPKLFKWITFDSVDSVGLLIYRKHQNDSSKRMLVARYELMGSVQSAEWQRESLSPGKYEWQLLGYKNESPNAVFSDTANFTVEELSQFSSESKVVGFQVGISRGSYQSIDGVYNIGFDTTPTILGIRYQAGKNNRITSANFLLKDFVLLGSVNQSMSFQYNYMFQLNKPSSRPLDYFAGPSARILQFPLVRSADGVNITKENSTSLNPGASFLLQYKMNLSWFLFAEATLDLPVVGSSSPDLGLDQLNTNIRIGGIYTIYWPFGVSGEFNYQSNKISFTDNGSKFSTTVSGISYIAYLYYLL